MDVWERSFNEERVRDAESFSSIKTYIENNPLRAGMVKSAQDFQWSSAARHKAIDTPPAWLSRG